MLDGVDVGETLDEASGQGMNVGGGGEKREAGAKLMVQVGKGSGKG